MDKVATVDPDDLEKEALAAAAEARSLAALSEVRVRYLGRRSALKLALRDVRDRESGMTLNAVRETVESALSAREEELARAELEERLATERVDVTLPAELLGPPKLRPRGTLHPSTLVRRDVEDIFLGLGYEIVDGREVETTRYNFDALGFPDWHPARSPRDTLFLDEHTLLRTETSPAQIHKMEERRPPIYMISIGRVYRRDTIDATHFPIFHQFEGLAIDQGITLADLKGTLLYVMRAAVRGRARGAVPHALLPLHGALDGARRLVLQLRRRRLPGLQALRLDRDGRLGDGRSVPVRVRRLGAGGVQRASRSGWASSAPRSSATGFPGSARSGTTTSASSGSSDEDPAQLAARVRAASTRAREEIADALSISTAEVNGVHRVGVPGDLGLFRVGHVLEAEKHPDADRLQLTSVEVGEDRPYSIVCGAWNFGAGAKVAVALPGATLPNGLTLERRKLRGAGLRGDDPGRGRARPRHRPLRDHRARRRARGRGRRSPTCCRSSTR